MQSPKCLFIAMTAGTVLSTAAYAQLADQEITNAEAITINQIQGGDYKRGGYSSRADLEVYQVGIPSETGGGFFGSGINVYDDAIFGGPYTSNANPLVLNGMAIGFILPGTFPPVNGDQLYTRVTFYPNHDNVIAAPATPYSGTPTVIANLNWGAGWTVGATPGSVRYYGTSIPFNGTIATLTNADVFNGGPTDRTAGAKIEPFHDAAFTIRATEYQVVRRGTFTTWKVGSSDYFGWFSANAAEAATGEIPQTSRSGGTLAASRATYMGFLGTGFVPAEPPSEVIALSDGTVTRSGTLADNTAKVYKITVPNGALDALSTFLDIDTEGSASDFAVAVYDANSAAATYSVLANLDRDSGSGTNAQLSYGMGRRAAVGDGRQYDGRSFYNGAAGLAAGDYLVVIAPNASSFADGWGITPSGTGGSYTLRLTTNAVNGTPLAPSVAPALAAGDDLVPNPLVAPGQQYANVALDAGDVRFIRFVTCRDATDAEPVTFDYTGTDTAGFSMTLFNGAGNYVTQVIVAGAAQPPAATVFNSSNPLPAGEYYMALYYAGVQTQPNNPTTDGRFHIRGTTGNNGFGFAGAILVNNTDCALACGTSDFNGDGDFGTDADIEAFFACLAGNCCPTCYPGGSDFNADGDFGTDADIESFFRVLAGGPC